VITRKKINNEENLEAMKDFLVSIIKRVRVEKLDRTIEVVLHLAKVSIIYRAVVTSIF